MQLHLASYTTLALLAGVSNAQLSCNRRKTMDSVAFGTILALSVFGGAMRRFHCCFVLGCLLAGDSLEAQPAFFRKDIPVADRPNTVIIGDFNGDSRPDMAVGSSAGTSILLNAGRGDFGRPIHLDSLISPKLAT